MDCIWIFYLVFCGLTGLVHAGYKTVCYYESWAVYRRLDSRLGADFTVNPPPCTHLIYAFALIKDGQIAPFDANIDLDGPEQYGGYQKFNLINKGAKAVKTLLAVGGWNAGSKEFSDMASMEETREMFAQQAVSYLRQYGFNGLDIDWEYPADRDGSRPEDKENLSALLQELRDVFNAEELKPGDERLLLTIAVSPHPDKLDKSYDMPTIAKAVDFVNIMTYDYARAAWTAEIKPHNPLWKRPEDTDWNSKLNADWAVRKMITDGVPSEKLILGIPTYGVTYKIPDDGKVPRVHGSHLGSGDAGPATKEKGFLAFYEICRKLKMERGWVSSMDEAGVPVCYRKNVWISYENPKSTRTKALYAMRSKMGGAMVWSLATDDFNGFCYGKPYPITQTLRDTFDASNKLMSRNQGLYGGSSRNQPDSSPNTNAVAEYCLSDGQQCKQSVFCPEVKRTFLPYELACVNVLGKCSYPKIQICDVPKVGKATFATYNKVSIIIPELHKNANLSCTSGISPLTAELPVTSLGGKCRKTYLTCEGNLLGGYNVVNYVCPAVGEFDEKLKVCKLPDAYDGDEGYCQENAVVDNTQGNYLTNSMYGYSLGKSGAQYAAFASPAPFFDQASNSAVGSRLRNRAPDLSLDINNYNSPSDDFSSEMKTPYYIRFTPTYPTTTTTTETPDTEITPTYIDSQNRDPFFENMFRKQTDRGITSVDSMPDDDSNQLTANGIDLSPPKELLIRKRTRLPIPPATQAPPPPSEQQFFSNNELSGFRYDNDQSADTEFSSKSRPAEIQPAMSPRFIPKIRPSQEQQIPAPVIFATRKKAFSADGLVRNMRDELPTRSPDRSTAQKVSAENSNELTRNFCAPIGSRTSNPSAPCSASFLLCLTPFTLMELQCAAGLIFEQNLGFCVPKNQAACSRM